MEVWIVLISIVVLVLLVKILNRLSDRFDVLDKRLAQLEEHLKPQRELRRGSLADAPVRETTVTPPAPTAPAPQPAQVPPITVVPPPRITPPPAPAKPEEVLVHKTVITPETPAPRPAAPPKPPKPGFFERNPDLEKFIGENLVNKFGIGVLVLGIGYFVKYAIDQDWINEVGRVLIGVLCGGILLATAHYMRKTFAAFSSVLVGGGIAVLYLTIAIAFHEYGMFGQTVAFLIMLVITAFTILLSLGYNRIELAVIAILGGFASPFMVSTGEGNYLILFTYILLLDGGMLVLAYFKKWTLVNIITYVFTILLFGSWLTVRFEPTDISMTVNALLFATAFYFVFFAMSVVNNVKEKVRFNGLEIGMLLSNSFLYFSAGLAILREPPAHDFQGLFTAMLGVFNFVFAYTLFKNNRVDRTLVFLLIGLVLTFISLAAPIQLEGNYITLFWAAEAVLLLWLSQKSGIRMMSLSSVIVAGLMLISLLMDWFDIYALTNEGSLTVILNKGFITGVVVLVSVVLTAWLLRNDSTFGWFSTYRRGLRIGAGVLLYLVLLLELDYQLNAALDSMAAHNIIVGAYNMLFIAALLLAEPRLEGQWVKNTFPFLGPFALLMYITFYHQQVILTRNAYLYGDDTDLGIAFHYILVALLVFNAAWCLPRMKGFTAFIQNTGTAYWWFFITCFLFIVSAELDHAILLLFVDGQHSIDAVLRHSHKIGYPILWGISSFVLIALGLKYKIKVLRIISLTLFAITLLKLFTVDIQGISEGGKIAAFISLGVLLLVVSFMYQRLKKLLLNDESTEPTESPKPPTE